MSRKAVFSAAGNAHTAHKLLYTVGSYGYAVIAGAPAVGNVPAAVVDAIRDFPVTRKDCGRGHVRTEHTDAAVALHAQSRMVKGDEIVYKNVLVRNPESERILLGKREQLLYNLRRPRLACIIVRVLLPPYIAAELRIPEAADGSAAIIIAYGIRELQFVP